MTIIFTTVGRNPSEEMKWPSWSTRAQNAVLVCNLKNDTMISVRFQGKPFNITVIHVYTPTNNAEEAVSWMVLWRATRTSRTSNQKRCRFHYRGLEYKSRKSRNTWSNGQIWPWNTEWSRAKANRVLPRELTGESKHPLSTTEEKILHGHHQMVNFEIRLIIFFAAKDGEALYSQQKTRPGADCGSDHELLIAKFRLKLKKVGKTTRPFRYDLN